MEKQISELNENEIAELIYDRIDAYWGKFPNLWKYVTKDDIATDSALDLYRPRKDSGIPNIVYYNSTKGSRSLKPLVGLVVYNVLMHTARFIHSTGIYNNESRRNVYSAMSLSTVMYTSNDGDSITLEDILPDYKSNTETDALYKGLIEGLPNKEFDNVFYVSQGKYCKLSYRVLLSYVEAGYNFTQMNSKLYRINRAGEYTNFSDASAIVKEMKQELKKYLVQEYNYTEEKYKEGWSIL